jgi:hypothetical protein
VSVTYSDIAARGLERIGALGDGAFATGPRTLPLSRI